MQRARRVAQTALVFGKLIAPRIVGKPWVSPARLRVAFESMGATYVKIGQFIASAPSMFPGEYVEAFEGCLDQAHALPFQVIDRVLRRQYDRPLEECFSEIDETPLGSASIAQVHAARLKDGTEVVLKVLKPGVPIKLQTDTRILRTGVKLAEWFYPVMNLARSSDIAEDMSRVFAEECDFLLEAERMKRFEAFLIRLSMREVAVPRVFDELTTREVLVMERFHGQPLTDVMRSGQRSVEHGAALSNALNAWLTSVTFCDFFHADVHAGNLLLLDNGRIGFIDFGIVGTVDPESWQTALALVGALAKRQSNEVAHALVKIGAANQDVDLNRLSQDLDQVLGRLAVMGSGQQSVGTQDDKPDQLVRDIFAVGEKHGLRFPRELFLLLKQYVYFDRYLRVISPGMVDVFAFGSLGKIMFR